MTTRTALTCAGLALVASACTNLPLATRWGTAPAAEASAPAAPRDEAPLYARDGSVVAGGSAASDEPAPRELQTSETGRTYILELYQKAIDERETLRREVDTLHAELSLARQKLAQSDGQTQTLEARIAALEAENQRRLDENVDLAARLVTAQIRRLQAEKILLEARIAERGPVTAQSTEHP